MDIQETTPSSEKKPGGYWTVRNFRILVWFAIVALAGIVVWQNWGEVDTPVLFMTIRMPRSLLMLLMLAAGFLIGIFSPLRRGGPKGKS
jgi:uncharacterized integral membrane protein